MTPSRHVTGSRANAAKTVSNMATSAPPSRRSLFSILACVCVFALLILLFDDDACSETRFIGRQLITPNHHHSLLTRSFLDGSPHPGFSPFVFVTYLFSISHTHVQSDRGGGGATNTPRWGMNFDGKLTEYSPLRKGSSAVVVVFLLRFGARFVVYYVLSRVRVCLW